MAKNKPVRAYHIEIAGITALVLRKRIKNIYIHIQPPAANVVITAPLYLKDDDIREFLASKANWVTKQKEKMLARLNRRELKLEWGEVCYLLGKRYILKIFNGNRPSVYAEGANIVLRTRPDSSIEERRKLLEMFYREQLFNAAGALIEKWGRIIGITPKEWRIKRMKTRWGSCNVGAKRVWLSLELALMPIECIEYIVVHEIVHLLEAKHNARFKRYMDRFLPDWKARRAMLSGGNPISDPREQPL